MNRGGPIYLLSGMIFQVAASVSRIFGGGLREDSGKIHQNLPFVAVKQDARDLFSKFFCWYNCF